MDTQRISGVYAITKKDTNRVYIGSALNIEDRIKTHFSSLDKNIHHCGFWQNDYNKNELSQNDFEVEILFTSDNEEEIRKVEKLFIEQFDKTHAIYNSILVVNGTYVLSDEIKDKIRKKQTGKRYSNEVNKKKSRPQLGEQNGMYGKKHKEETKMRVSKANSGENNFMAGKSVMDVWIEKYGNDIAEQKYNEWKESISDSTSGKNNPMFGKVRVKGISKEEIISIYNELQKNPKQIYKKQDYQDIANKLNVSVDHVVGVRLRRLGRGIIKEYKGEI